MNDDVALVIQLGAEVGSGQRLRRRYCGFALSRLRTQLAFAAVGLRLVPPQSIGGGEGRCQSFRYSRSRFVCARLTGISVPFASFIRRM